MLDKYAEKFAPWSVIELKCNVKKCATKTFYSPYELMLHHKNYHIRDGPRFIQCSQCSKGDFTFSDFFQHVIEQHYKHLRYW
jgi:hypothetical protein